MLVRLWLFTPRVGPYPEGGTYDTSVMDSTTGNCSDPEQFDRFQNLLAYSNSRGERLQQVSSAQQAYSLCSQARLAAAPTNAPNVAVSVGGTSSAFQGGTFEQGMYSPPSEGGWCGCNCSGGGQKIMPNVYTDPTLQVNTQPMATQHTISSARNKPFGTISY